MVKRGDAVTLAAGVRDALRQAIIAGEFPPDSPLNSAKLGEKYAVSSGVVREALVRLVEQSLVVSDSNRGFRVASISRSRLADMTEMRIVIEQLAVGWSLERGGLTWETEVIATHHQLAATPRESTEWDVAHRAFHRTLVAASGSREAIALCSRAFHWSAFHQRWAAPASAERWEIEADHTPILEPVLSRDTAGVMRALRDHYEQAAAIMLRSGLLDHEENLVPSREIE